MRPLVGASSPPIIASSEVLPEPLGPVSATNSPGSRVSDTSATETIGPGWTRETPSTTTRAPETARRPGSAVSSAMNADLPAVGDRPHALHGDDGLEDQVDPDRPARPDERVV